MRPLLNRLLPFFILGIAVVIFLFGVMLLAYLFLFGVIAGAIIYLFNKIRDHFRPTVKVSPPPQKGGRIIDSNDYKEL